MFHDSKCERTKYGRDECYCEHRKNNHSEFIRLWTAAGTAPNYNKKAWMDVESQLSKANVI